jgi:hypothetical protein
MAETLTWLIDVAGFYYFPSPQSDQNAILEETIAEDRADAGDSESGDSIVFSPIHFTLDSYLV